MALAACGSVAGQHASTGSAATPATPAQASPRGTLAQTTCGPPPPRHAWAVEVTRTGHTAWETPLETRGTMPSPVVQPVVAGPVAVLAQDGIVHGIRLADGHPLWSWPGGQSVYGLWRWGGLVAVLTDQVSNHARLTGLDAATGAVRWSLRLPARGLLGGQALTADGGLAMAVTGQGLQVVNLADGRVRWQRRIAASPALTAAGGLVIYGLNGHLTGYDARTGRPRWVIAPGMSPDPAFQLLGGLLLVTSNAAGPSIPNTVTAVVPATGRVAWRFHPFTPATDPGAQASVLSAGPGGLAVATYDPRRLYLLDLRTGRPRWHADTFVTQGIAPAGDRRQRHPHRGPEPRHGGRPRRGERPGAVAGLRPRTVRGLPARPGGRPAGDPAGRTRGPGGHGPAARLPGGQRQARLAGRACRPSSRRLPVLVPGGILVQPADLGYACATAR